MSSGEAQGGLPRGCRGCRRPAWLGDLLEGGEGEEVGSPPGTWLGPSAAVEGQAGQAWLVLFLSRASGEGG